MKDTIDPAARDALRALIYDIGPKDAAIAKRVDINSVVEGLEARYREAEYQEALAAYHEAVARLQRARCRLIASRAVA